MSFRWGPLSASGEEEVEEEEGRRGWGAPGRRENKEKKAQHIFSYADDFIQQMSTSPVFFVCVCICWATGLDFLMCAKHIVWHIACSMKWQYADTNKWIHALNTSVLVFISHGGFSSGSLHGRIIVVWCVPLKGAIEHCVLLMLLHIIMYIYIYKKIRYKNKKQYFFNPNLWFVWYRTTMYAQIFVRFLPIARNTRDHCACTQNNGGHGFYSQWNVQYSDIDSAFKWVFTTFLQRIMILIVTIIFQWL